MATNTSQVWQRRHRNRGVVNRFGCKLGAMFCVSAALVSLLCAGQAFAQVKQVYVDAAGQCEGNTPCYEELGIAVTVLPDAGTVTVYPGEYDSKPFRTYDATCGNCPVDFGGFEAGGWISTAILVSGKSITIRGQSPEDTIIRTNASYGFLFSQSKGSVIEGITIASGVKSKDKRRTDAAVLVRNSEITLRTVHIVDNDGLEELKRRNGDVYVDGIAGVAVREGGKLLIEDSVIRNNSSHGIILYRSDPTLDDDQATATVLRTLIADGAHPTSKAGIRATGDSILNVQLSQIHNHRNGIEFFDVSTGSVTNSSISRIKHNGLTRATAGAVQITNNVFFDIGERGVVSDGVLNLALSNNVFYANAEGISLYHYGEPYPGSYNAFFGNHLHDVAMCFEQECKVYSPDGDYLPTARNVRPEFVNPGQRDFRLKCSSPLINAGDPDAKYADVDQSQNDIGQYGGPNGNSDYLSECECSPQDPNAGYNLTASGWQRSLWANPDLDGDPVDVRSFETPAGFREIWSGNDPLSCVPGNAFSARYSGDRWFDGTEYEINMIANSGVRIYVAGELVLDEWDSGESGEYTVAVAPNPGKHSVIVDYVSTQGDAALWFELGRPEPDEQTVADSAESDNASESENEDADQQAAEEIAKNNEKLEENAGKSNHGAVWFGPGDVPENLAPGDTLPVIVRVTNGGSATWRHSASPASHHGYRLAATSANTVIWSNSPCGQYSNAEAPETNRAYICADDSVVPNQTYSFYFDVTAPDSGPAQLGVEMIEETRDRFGVPGSRGLAGSADVSAADGFASVKVEVNWKQLLRQKLGLSN